MRDVEPVILEELQRLSPFDPDAQGDWQGVLDQATRRNAPGGLWPRWRGDRRAGRDVSMRLPRRPRSLLAAAVVLAAVVAAPALAFSAPVRQFLGLEYPPVGPFRATITGVSSVRTYRYALPKIMVRFTIGKAGGPPGSGIRKGTSVLVYVSGKTGNAWDRTVVARGGNGRYSATTLAPPGRIAAVYIMGFVPSLRHPQGVYFSVPVIFPAHSSY